jgi:hypothetical protein
MNGPPQKNARFFAIAALVSVIGFFGGGLTFPTEKK